MPFDIPYHLETRQDILRAKQENLLDIGLEYEVMEAVERRLTIIKPPALEKAHPVIKDFFHVRSELVIEADLKHLERSRLDLTNSFHHIELALPWAADLARCNDFIELLQIFPLEVQKRCWGDSRPGTMTGRFEATMEAQKIIKEEALAISRTGRTRSLTREDLRRLIAGRVLFEPENEDILKGLRDAINDSRDGAAIYQNVCAELLFTRIPSFVSLIARMDPKLFRRKFLDRVAKLGMTPREKMAIFAYFPGEVSLAALFPAMEKVSAAARRILGQVKADLIDDSITGFRHKVNMIKTLYDGLFLTPELKQIRKLHYAGLADGQKRLYNERITRARTHLDTIAFFPTKDYLDLCKAKFSSDCTGLDLSEKHLETPAYFNVRIFRGAKWIGNLYMLDFTESDGVLVLDRIQVPRDLNVTYINFFGHLLEIFREMFSSVENWQVLMPVAISNHGFIQAAWNGYRKGLKKMKFQGHANGMEHFESLQRKRDFYVLE